MNSQKGLPKHFESLLPYLDWAQPTETLRRKKRESSSMEEIQAFYDAVLALAPQAMDYLRKTGSTSEANADTHRFYLMMLAFADASLSIEIHKSPIVPDGMPGDVWKPEHETEGWQRKPRIDLSIHGHSNKPA